MKIDLFFSQKSRELLAIKALDRRTLYTRARHFAGNDEYATVPMPSIIRQAPQPRRQFITIKHILKLEA